MGRLIAGLGKLASGSPIEDFVPAPVPVKAAAGEAEDVDMVDATPSSAVDEINRSNTPVAGGGGGGKPAKGKKKGKGKKHFDY